MKRYKNQRLKLLLMLTVLSVFGIGIVYSALTEKLYIDSSVAINEMKWDIGFSSSEDNGGSALSESTISEDGKTLTVLCDFGANIEQKKCTTKATITNNSTFNVSLNKTPNIIYDDTYIHTATFKWVDHPTYENRAVLKDNFIAKGESEEVILTINSKFLNLDSAPTTETLIPITVTLDFVEWSGENLPVQTDLAILKSTTDSDTTAFRSSTYKEKIKTITFENKINVPASATESWDIGVNAGKVMAYVIPNAANSSYYDLHIQSDTQLYANNNMEYWFSGFTSVESINGLYLLDTSSVTNMAQMFYTTGKNSNVFVSDLTNFDTSEVTNMNQMFYHTGYNSQVLQFDVSNFDTSKVTDTSGMFRGTGYITEKFALDVDNFNTSNVTNMNAMFYATGRSSKNFNIDISNFDTSKVTDMAQMFYRTGYSSEIVEIDVSNFDTSNVTDMKWMFRGAGYNNKSFTLDVSNFDTTNVTNMELMFDGAGYNSTIIAIDVSDWNTSNVTKMGQMFYEVGYNNPRFKLDVSGWDTSKVVDMYQMFYEVGYNNPNFVLDVSNFNTSKVSDMDHMFYNTGYSNPNFTLDVSNFDTTRVNDMAYMFYQTGYNSTKLNIVITIRNPSLTKYEGIFEGIATKEGAQVTVNYTSETSALVDAMIATKSANSNVVKGVQVD